LVALCSASVVEVGEGAGGLVDADASAAALPQDLPVFEAREDVFDGRPTTAVRPPGGL
jgi:hypothetical protein